LREDTSRVFTLRIREARCIGVVAVAREGVVDLNLSVSNDAGAELAHDDRNDAHPYVRVCPSTPGDLYVRVVAARGSGEVGAMLIADAPLVAPPLDGVLGTRPSSLFAGPRVPRAEVGRDPAAMSATEALARATARWLAEGYQRVGAVRTGQLAPQQSTHTTISLDEGHCYVLQAVGGDHVDDLDVRVLAPDRRPLAQDVGLDARPVVRFCAPSTGEFAVDLRMFAGSGEWALAAFEIPSRAPHTLSDDVRGVARARSLEVAHEASRRSFVPRDRAVRGAPWAGATLPFGITMRAGRCYMLGAVGDEVLVALDLWLQDPTGAVLAADTNERERAVIYHCARRNMTGTAFVRVQGGRGEYVFQSFESAEVSP
jgi:hypothetical protein